VTIEQILREAIQGEVEAFELYNGAVEMVRAEHIKELLDELAQEEADIVDYKIADHLVAHPLGPDSTFQDVCIFAAQKEQESHELYRSLASQNRGETRDLLEAMAKDELRHKNLVEGWYEEIVYQEF
jgi:rubrerythrin